VTSDSPNQRFYDTTEVVEIFASGEALFQAEETIIASLQDEIRDKPMLELGVGAGRVTPLVTALSKDYVGADSSPKMIDKCRQRFGDARFLVCDARRMPIFESDSFAAVFFFWNGIDEVSPPDRILILREVRRVLKPNGVFVFSSHNLDWEDIPAYALNEFWARRNPLAFVRGNAMRLRAFVSAFLAKRRSRRHDGFAVIPEYEEALHLLVPRYFIRKEAQVKQLLETGFSEIEAFAAEGAVLDSRNRGADHLVYYVARKAESAAAADTGQSHVTCLST
jgi:ubiquinone/menaquinone biosynthesis C-methylase UbiE